MPEFSNTAAAISGFVTAITGVLVLYAGYVQKGKDQRFASETTSHDQIQEDLSACRAESDRQRKRADEYQQRFDDSELARVEEISRFREASFQDQSKRHELRSIVRALLVRIEDHSQVCSCSSKIAIDDLRDRVKKLDQ